MQNRKIFSKNNIRDSRRLEKALIKEKDFLIKNLEEEWRFMERAARKEDLAKRYREALAAGGKAVGLTLLVLLALGGVVLVAAVAPNIFSAFCPRTRRRAYFSKKEFHPTAHYLKSRNLLRYSKEEGVYRLESTEGGIKRALAISYRSLKVPKPEKWDGVWRIIIFDIPERHKWSRDRLRHKLREMGFYQLQKSAFVIPYPCEEELVALASLLNISDNVHLIETERMTEKKELTDFFDLKKKQ